MKDNMEYVYKNVPLKIHSSVIWNKYHGTDPDVIVENTQKKSKKVRGKIHEIFLQKNGF